jgi:thiol-disulfide isomerase/thioredoxin
MLTRRHLLAGFALNAALLSSFALAADKQHFEAKAFESAQAAGKPILVEVTAPWCPTCKAQAPILQRLTTDLKFKNLQVFSVDFDTRKDVLKQFKVRTQSTLIVFKGNVEQGRSTGDTNEASIAALLNKAI